MTNATDTHSEYVINVACVRQKKRLHEHLLINVTLHVHCLSSLFRFLRLTIYNVLVFPLILYFSLPCTYYLIVFLEEYSLLKCDAKCINVSDEPLAAVMKAETEGFYETSVNFYNSTRRNIPYESGKLNTNRSFLSSSL